MEILDIVDDNDKIIGQASINEAHEKGLRHREVHVWFYSPNGELIWQCRSKNKELYAGFLDATVGGHVSSGQIPLDAAIRETGEETGIEVGAKDLQLIRKVRSDSSDPSNGLVNNVFRYIYAYPFNGKLEDLRIEEGEISHFEIWKISSLVSLTKKQEERFIPILLNKESLSIYREIQNLIKRGGFGHVRALENR